MDVGKTVPLSKRAQETKLDQGKHVCTRLDAGRGRGGRRRGGGSVSHLLTHSRRDCRGDSQKNKKNRGKGRKKRERAEQRSFRFRLIFIRKKEAELGGAGNDGASAISR